MPVTKEGCTDRLSHTETGLYKFEIVHSFTYLGSDVNCKNGISAEIQKRLLCASRCVCGLRKHLKSHLIQGKQK
jgi:hypothetical protein